MQRQIFIIQMFAFMIALSSSAGEIVEISELEKIAQAVASEREEFWVNQHPMAPYCMLLDFGALAHDVFYHLGKSGFLSEHEFQLIMENFKRLYSLDFKRLEEERLDAFTCLGWHPMASVNLPKFKELLYQRTLNAQVLTEIASRVSTLKDDEIIAESSQIVRSLATKETFRRIVELWVILHDAHGESGCVSQ